MACEGCCRAALIAFNLVFFLVGAAALAVGIWVLVDGTIFLQLLAKIPDSGAYASLIQDAAYIFIAAGAGIFVLAFLGCCGAWKKNKCMLITYAIIVGVFLALEIACVVVAYFFSDNVVTVLKTNLADALGASYNSTFTSTSTDNQYEYKSSDILSKGVDALQLKFTCCGVHNYTDYGFETNGATKAPITCCATTSVDSDLNKLVNEIWGGSGTFTVSDSKCPGNSTALAEVKGCYQSIYDYVMDKSIILMAIGGGCLGVQLLLILMSCCLFCAIRNEEQKP